MTVKKKTPVKKAAPKKKTPVKKKAPARKKTAAKKKVTKKAVKKAAKKTPGKGDEVVKMESSLQMAGVMPSFAAVKKAATGRPHSYTRERGVMICYLLSHGYSLVKITDMPDMPGYSTVTDWIRNEDGKTAEFSAMYVRAREDQADYLAEQIVEIASEPVQFSEQVARNRLRVDAHKWYAAKLAPRKYNDKSGLTLENPDGSNLSLTVTELVRQYVPSPPPRDD